MSYQCTCCGKWHQGPPMTYGAEAPALYYTVAEEDRARRVELSPDQCVIDNKYFFVRACLELPVGDTPEPFVWGVWVSLSAPNFVRMQELWGKPGREKEPPFFAWLSTELPCYPSTTLNLKTNVHTRPVGTRPRVELEPTGHPLAIEQRDGITMARVQEIAETIRHRAAPN